MVYISIIIFHFIFNRQNEFFCLLEFFLSQFVYTYICTIIFSVYLNFINRKQENNFCCCYICQLPIQLNEMNSSSVAVSPTPGNLLDEFEEAYQVSSSFS